MDNDMKARERIVRLLLYVLAKPNKYTLKDLAKYFKVSIDTIEADIDFLEYAGISVKKERKGRANVFAIEVNDGFDELRYLQPLSEQDIASIHHGLNYLTDNTKSFYLKKKLNTLYDFQKLGLNALRKPNLERINQLEKAIKSKKLVTLKNYKSNSNDIRDREVEVFLISPEIDTIQAFDVNDKKVKHFKLSRIDTVLIEKIDWKYESRHDERPTDVFRIAMKGQIWVELTIDVYAYNSLIDNYPKAKGECQSMSTSHTFHFQSKVNPKFFGLTNFIMNNAGHVQIISPPGLKEKVREKIADLLKDLDES